MSVHDRGRMSNRARPGKGSQGSKVNVTGSQTRSRSKSEQNETQVETAKGLKGGSRFNCMQYLCIYCEEYCKSDDDTDWSQNVTQCNKCKGWLHKECIPLPRDQIEILFRNMVDYVCETCSQAVDNESDEDAMYGITEEQLTQGKTFHNVRKEVENKNSDGIEGQDRKHDTLSDPPNNTTNQRLDAMMSLLQETRNKIVMVDANMNKTTERLDAIDKKIAEQLPAIDQKVKDIVDMHIGNALENFEEDIINKKIDDALQEYNEREWRKKNAILVNIKESRKPSIPEKQEDDLVVVTRIFNRIADFKGLDDLEHYPVRIGKPGDRPRLLRVTFRHEFMARIMIQRAREMNDAINPFEQDKKKRIYVNRDFTFREREMRRELKNELKVRQSRGEKNLTIRRNQIVEIQQNQVNHKTYAATAKLMLPNHVDTDDSYHRRVVSHSFSHDEQYESQEFRTSSPKDKSASVSANEEMNESQKVSNMVKRSANILINNMNTDTSTQATPKINRELQNKQATNQTEFIANRIMNRMHSIDAIPTQREGTLSPQGRGLNQMGRGMSPRGRGISPRGRGFPCYNSSPDPGK